MMTGQPPAVNQLQLQLAAQIIQNSGLAGVLNPRCIPTTTTVVSYMLRYPRARQSVLSSLVKIVLL